MLISSSTNRNLSNRQLSNRNLSKFLTFLIATVAFVFSAAPSPAIEAESLSATETAKHYSTEELLRFAKLFEQIKQLYVDEITDAELLDMAIHGLLEQLDPHSEYLSSEKHDFIEQNSEGTFTGIGVELSMEDGELTIVTPLDQSPAAEAGLRPGDVIISIQGQSTWGMSLHEALETMDEIVDRSLQLMISRNFDDPFEVTLSRSTIALDSVKTGTLAHDVGYIRVRQFQKNTGNELKEKVSSLLSDHPYLIGLVLDLRNNPGGILQAAVDVSDAFMDKGLIVSTVGRDPGSNAEFYASQDGIAQELPVIVVINRGSASAAEIVAGALQDHKRAIILGDISFGKGSVQNIIPLDNERSIKLTTARYYTPSGRSIQAQGIYPDISVQAGEISFEDQDGFFSESDLNHHLETSNSGDTPELLGFRETLGDIKDIQLSQAVSLLKGMAIQSR